MLAIPRRFPFIRVWPSPVYDGQVAGTDRHIKAGMSGQADITGIIGQSAGMSHLGGTRLEVEVKAGKDRMRDSQIVFKSIIDTHQGIYMVARSVDGCLDALAAEISRRQITAVLG